MGEGTYDCRFCGASTMDCPNWAQQPCCERCGPVDGHEPLTTAIEAMRVFEGLIREGDLYRPLRQEKVGPYYISTVKLGVPEAYPLPGFETMVFRGEDSDGEILYDFQVRYETEVEALAGHAAMVRLIGGADVGV